MCSLRSGVGATVDADALPASAVLAAQPLELRRECTLAGGDDYELLFTAPPALAEGCCSRPAGCAATRIGRIEAEPGLRIVDRGGRALDHTFAGFDHFKT